MLLSRTPPGVRELKLPDGRQAMLAGARRTPPGVRELKPAYEKEKILSRLSHPSRGA